MENPFEQGGNPKPPDPNNPFAQQPNQYQGNPYAHAPMYGGQLTVPNSTLVLVFGIIGIVMCGLGPILGTIGLVLSGKGRKLYNANPGMYSKSSYDQMNAGRICSIIGLIIGCLVWIFLIWRILWMYYMISQMEEAMMQDMPY
ncbi:MAG TPA: CCC motif membrane protein [Bacteroidia bacterium]|nr:CCC motif membrane protein [Bacteroidia bacterium]